MAAAGDGEFVVNIEFGVFGMHAHRTVRFRPVELQGAVACVRRGDMRTMPRPSACLAKKVTIALPESARNAPKENFLVSRPQRASSAAEEGTLAPAKAAAIFVLLVVIRRRWVSAAPIIAQSAVLASTARQIARSVSHAKRVNGAAHPMPPAALIVVLANREGSLCH